MSDRFYRLAFLIASIFNVCAGILCLVFTRLSIEVFFGPQADPDNLVAILFYRVFMLSVIAFGAGYFMVFCDLSKNRGIVWLSAFSKLILLVIFTIYVAAGSATIYLQLAVAPGFLFMLVFFLFLWQKRTDAG